MPGVHYYIVLLGVCALLPCTTEDGYTNFQVHFQKVFSIVHVQYLYYPPLTFETTFNHSCTDLQKCHYTIKLQVQSYCLDFIQSYSENELENWCTQKVNV